MEIATIALPINIGIWTIPAILIIYLIFKKIKTEKKETFEKIKN